MEIDTEEQFMPSEGLMNTEDSSQWDVLVNQGIGTDSVSKWDRESLFIKFDPLVCSQIKKEKSDPSPPEYNKVEQSSPDYEDLPINVEPSEMEKEFLVKEECEMPDGNEFPEVIPQDQLIKPEVKEHTFAVPKTPKLVPIETPPPAKALTVSIAPILCSSELFKVAPPGVEPDLSELGLTETPTSATDEMSPSLTMNNYSQMNGSNNKEAMIQEALSAQKEQFLSQLAEKDEKIQELMDAKMKEEQSITVDEDKKTSRVLVEYEKTMSSYVEKIEELKKKLATGQVDKLEALKERDQALEDLKHVEDAFSLLHQKYERVKGTLENFRKNEEILKNRDQELIIKVENRDKKIESMKEEANSRLTVLCQDYETKYSSLQSENLKLRALLRKNEMTLQTLEQNLEQKQKENTELNKLCEELIGGGLNVK